MRWIFLIVMVLISACAPEIEFPDVIYNPGLVNNHRFLLMGVVERQDAKD